MTFKENNTLTPKSWVLILIPSNRDRHPAIIGGYESKESAEEAGKIATKISYVEFEDYTYVGMPYGSSGIGYASNGGVGGPCKRVHVIQDEWEKYTIIPGAAS